MRSLFGVLLGVGLTTIAPGCGGSSKTGGETASLDGTYTLIGMEAEGESMSAEELGKKTEDDRLFRIEGNRLIARKGGQDDPITFKTDASRNPKEIDFTETDGGGKSDTAYGIYKLEGDTLTICVSPKAETRPKEFKTAKSSRTMMMTLKKK